MQALRAGAAAGAATAMAAVLSAWIIGPGGIVALLVPPCLFAAAGWIGGAASPDRRLRAGGALSNLIGGVGSLLAIVSTQAAMPGGFFVAYAVPWTFGGFIQAAMVFDAVGTTASERRRGFGGVISAFAAAGLAGGLLCQLGLSVGGANDPLVEALLLLGVTLPPAAGGTILAWILMRRSS